MPIADSTATFQEEYTIALQMSVPNCRGRLFLVENPEHLGHDARLKPLRAFFARVRVE